MHQSVISRTSNTGSTGYQAQSHVLPDFGGVNCGRDKINIAVAGEGRNKKSGLKKSAIGGLLDLRLPVHVAGNTRFNNSRLYVH